MQQIRNLQYLYGLLIAPLAPGIVWPISANILSGETPYSLHEYFFLFMFSIPLSYVGALLLGVPSFLLLLKLRKLNALTIFLAGAITGGVFFSAILGFEVKIFVWGIFLGVITALVFAALIGIFPLARHTKNVA